jgi:hypothetical protein|tara:strand:+ start:15830 stop:16072 length:243 start_codon:yes stop_codon:yes gene_type:complete
MANYAIKKLDGTTEFTITDTAWDTMQAAADDVGRCELPSKHTAWIYIVTPTNKDTLLAELVTEHGEDNDAFRMGQIDTIE